MISLRNHTQQHTLKSVALKHSTQLCCSVAGSVCPVVQPAGPAAYFNTCTLQTHHYPSSTSGRWHRENDRDAHNGNANSVIFFFMFTELAVGWGGHGKQLRGRESCMEREKFCQECMKRTMEGGKEIMGKKKKNKEGVCNLERRRRRQRGCLATRSHCCVDEGLQA